MSSVSRRHRTGGALVGALTAALLALGGIAGPARGGGEECDGKPADIIGTPGDDAGVDQISGTPGDDVIVGLGGNDVISGGRGDDLICAGEGADRAFEGGGGGHIKSGPGDDVIFGGTGGDYAQGGFGDDELFGERGSDSLVGGADEDVCNGGLGRDFDHRCEADVEPPPNAAPVGVDDMSTTDEDTPATIEVLDNDTDPNDDGLSISAIDITGTKGTVVITAAGVEYDPDGQFEALGDGESDTETFDYTVSDGRGGADHATVTVTVNGN